MIAPRWNRGVVERPRIVLAGGGSGGHVYPGLALAQALAGCSSDVEVRLLATDRPIDRLILGRQRVPWEPFPALRPPGGAALGTALRAAPVLGCAVQRIRRLRPHAVVGLGGYGSVAPCLAAAGLRVPVFLLEPNRIPGRANRLLSHLAREVWIHFEGTQGALPRGTRTFRTGNPLRPGLRPLPAPAARVALGLDPHRPTLLVLGGSQGAAGVNRAVVASMRAIRRATPDLQVLHLTGFSDRDVVTEAYREASIPARVEAYLEEMERAYSAADLVVARSGAGTLAEITAIGVAAVLVPYPHHRDRHQLANALALESVGAARVCREDDRDDLAGTIGDLLTDGARREAMARRSKERGCPGAAAEALRRLEHWKLLPGATS
jgi:UDP-N-acetylglucosamine--N-acetylmuramyl-(pentapeptide) pyrophosphoryl-undecaprenol N-acetylglucosamine transferase